jgi:CDP-2,3-bis-(O-geranylgeranyl)-sn-glycerol synthase
MTPLLGFLLGFGAMAGDAAGSFLKRRLGLERGKPAPLLDQDDFIAGALLSASLLVAVRLEWAILLLVLTPVIHFAACIIGYLLKVKKEPW